MVFDRNQNQRHSEHQWECDGNQDLDDALGIVPDDFAAALVGRGHPPDGIVCGPEVHFGRATATRAEPEHPGDLAQARVHFRAFGPKVGTLAETGWWRRRW